jgi:hypothetical protein
MSNQLQVSGAAKIRTIQGPVVANSGVITALDGDASQYVRGDGTLADFPTSTGGGSSVSYYLNTSVSQGTIGGVAYKQLSKVPISGAGTDVTTSANGYIASYITDANDPALLEVPAGNFNCEFYFSVNSNAHNPYVYAEVYKYDGTTFTLLGSNVSIPQYLSNGTTLSPYYFAIAVSTSVLTVTDRIAIRIYVNVDGRTVTLHTENNHLCQVVTTFSKGLISLNNLTRQNQFFATGTSGTDFAISSATATHTFNLPVASASNTGKLSSTDWTTFNNKQNLLTNPVTGTGSDGRVAFWTGASSISSDANLYYDYSTDRLGIGTNTPNASLGILNASTTGIQVRTSDSANQYQANIFYDASYGMVYGYNRLGTGTASNLTFFNNIGGFISIPESATNNIGFNTLNPQGLAGASVYDFTSLNTNVELRLHNSSTGYTSTDGSYIRVTSTALVIGNDESSKSILINNGGNGVVTIDGTNKVAIGSVGVVPLTQLLTVIGSIEAYGGSIYQTVTSSMLKANASGQIIAAIAGTDYLAVGSAVTSVSATSPVLSSGGTTPTISIPAATTSVSGYLTSTDWTTFNNKFTLPSLTQGSILFSDGTTIAQNNNRLFWNNSTMRLGVGSQPVAQYVMYVKANVGENANAWLGIDNDNTTGSTALRLILNGSTTSGFQYVQSTNMTQIFANAGDIQLINGSSLGLTIANTTGNGTFSNNVYALGLGIGTTTLTSGWQSDTRGNVLISGSDSVSGRLNVYYGALGSSASQRFDVGSSTIDTYNLYVKTLSGGAFTGTVTAYITNAGAASFNSTLNVGTTAYVNTDIFIGDTTSGDGRLFITSPSNQGITLRRAGAADRFKLFVGNGTTYTQDNAIILGTNTDIDFYTGASPVKRLTITNAGGSTFSGDVTISKSGDAGLNLNSTTTNGVAVTRYQTTAAGSLWGTGINITGADSRWEVYNFALGSSPFFIRSNGKVNISTSVASDVLLNVVNSSSTGYGMNISAGGGSGTYALRVESYNGGSEFFRIRGDGKVTIPSGAYGTSYYTMNYTSANAGSREWAIGSDTAGWGTFTIGVATTQGGSTFSDKITIKSDGNVGINANPFEKLSVRGDANNWTANMIGVTTAGQSLGLLVTAGMNSSDTSFLIQKANSATTYFYVRGDGFVNAGTFTYNNAVSGRSMIVESGGGLGYLVSTRESKSNIKSITNVDFISQLNPVQFNYRKKDNLTNEYTDELYDNVTYGFIADEVEKVNKELVFYNEDGVTLAGVEYNSMIAILMKAVQELKAEIEILKNK